MPKLRKIMIGSAGICLSALAVDTGIHLLSWPISHEPFHLIAILAGFCAIATYCTKHSIDQLKATAATFRDAVSEENKKLHRAIVVQIEQYGDKREIDTRLQGMRQHVVNERAGREGGQETVDLYWASGERQPTNVTPLLRRRG